MGCRHPLHCDSACICMIAARWEWRWSRQVEKANEGVEVVLAKLMVNVLMKSKENSATHRRTRVGVDLF